MKMFFSKKKKRKSGVKKKERFNLKDFFTIPVTSLTLISLILISSFIFQLSVKEKQKTSIIDFEKLLRKNSYEKKTGHRIQIEILNGCGDAGIATLYSNFLMHEGFDVIESKNADNFDYLNTNIIVHDRTKMAIAQKLAKTLDIKNIVMNENGIWDLSIIIGKDYKIIDSFEKIKKHFSPF